MESARDPKTFLNEPIRFDSSLKCFDFLIDRYNLLMFGVFFPIFIVDYVLFEFQSRFHSKEILWCIRDFPTGKKVHYFPSVKQLFVGELYHGAILRII